MSMYRHRLLASSALSLGALAAAFLPIAASANPKDGVVVAGVATITQTSPATLTVNQRSGKAIIDWRSFSIASGETTQFNQSNASSIALNRVTGGDPSQILGNLTSNGQVWLVNPNGIVFGKSARVDVAGLLATTLDITNQDFMTGNYRFAATGTAPASVTNAGHITIRNAGLAALVAPGVGNSGVIEARLGRIQLSSADGFTVDFYGDGKFNFLLSQAVSNSLASGAPVGVANSGSLIADGGQILLTAQAAKSVVDQSINMSGYVEARTVGTQGGVITLDGGTAGAVSVSGTMDASGKTAGQTGGQVSVAGQSVSLDSTAMIDASGDAGGGSALVGGDRHGAGSLQNATTTTVDSGALINADAISAGSGGQVVVWSDDQTSFAGAISARGGAHSGNGGSVEVSGHRLLEYVGTVDLRAPQGAAGGLLLDPENVTIAATGDTPTVSGGAPIILNPTADDSVIQASTLEQALGLASVTVTTGSTGSQAGDITVATNVNWSSANSLTLSAYRNVVLNDGVTIANTGAGNLVLRADSTGTGIGAVSFNLNSATIDFSNSTGTISIFVDDYTNPAGSVVNSTSYTGNDPKYGVLIKKNTNITNQVAIYRLVNTVFDLQNIENNLSGNYALGKDIDASASATWNAGAGFIPIGGGGGEAHSMDFWKTGTQFAGVFDGQFHQIQNLTINGYVTDPEYDNYVGLFGMSSGLIENVALVSESITYNASNQHTGGCVNCISFVGGLVGLDLGTVINSSTSGQITSTSTNGPQLGGLVGHIATVDLLDGSTTTGLVETSFSNVNIVVSNSTDTSAGGLTGGVEQSTLSNSYATGTINGTTTGSGSTSGGLIAGAYQGSVAQSYSTGPATGDCTGGLVALCGASSLTLTNSYWDVNTSGEPTSGAGIGLSTGQLKSGLPAGFDPSVWAINALVNNGYPYLIANPPSPGGPQRIAPTIINFGNGVSPPPPPPPPPPPAPTPPPTFSITTFANGSVEIDVSQSAAQAAHLVALATSCATSCSADTLHADLNTALTGLGALQSFVVATGNFQVTDTVQGGVVKLVVHPLSVSPPPPPPPPPVGPPPNISITTFSNGGFEIDVLQSGKQTAFLLGLASDCGTSCLLGGPVVTAWDRELSLSLLGLGPYQPLALTTGYYQVTGTVQGGGVKLVGQPVSPPAPVSPPPPPTPSPAIGSGNAAQIAQLQQELLTLQSELALSEGKTAQAGSNTTTLVPGLTFSAGSSTYLSSLTTSPQQAPSLFTSLSPFAPMRENIQSSESSIVSDITELGMIVTAGSSAALVDKALTARKVFGDIDLIAHGQGLAAAKDASIQAVEQIGLNATKFSKVPGAGQVLDIGVQLTIILGAAATEEELKGELAAGNVIGNALYDSGIYTGLSKLFSGG